MAELWKVQLLAWAQYAADRCSEAHVALTNALPDLAQPLRVADATAGRDRAQSVYDILGVASINVALATESMATAEIFARYGGAASPAVPLPSFDYLPIRRRSVWLALGVLQCARVCAEEACDSMARCCGHLHTVYYLLGQPGLAGLDRIVEDQRDAARECLVAARGLAAS